MQVTRGFFPPNSLTNAHLGEGGKKAAAGTQKAP